MKDRQLVTIEFRCPVCGKIHYLEDVDYEALEAWQNGELIQNAFPDMSPADREKFLTGYCEDCQNRIFAEPEED